MVFTTQNISQQECWLGLGTTYSRRHWLEACLDFMHVIYTWVYVCASLCGTFATDYTFYHVFFFNLIPLLSYVNVSSFYWCLKRIGPLTWVGRKYRIDRQTDRYTCSSMCLPRTCYLASTILGFFTHLDCFSQGTVMLETILSWVTWVLSLLWVHFLCQLLHGVIVPVKTQKTWLSTW